MAGSLRDQLEPLIRGFARELVRNATPIVLGEFAAAAPVGLRPFGEGGPRLNESFEAEQFERGNAVGLTIRNTAEHASYVSAGTEAHNIEPLAPDGVLAWFDPNVGEMRFARQVHHPGTEPNPYFEKTAERWHELLEQGRFP